MRQVPDSFDIVIHHGNCYDGITAAWVARKHSPDAELIPAQYGQDPPDVKGKVVLIVDFSYSREVLESMKADAAELLVLDHHDSAAKDLEGLDYAVFDMERSGAGLAWDFLHHPMDRPDVVNYVEDRDLWRFKLPGSRQHHAAMTSLPMGLESIDKMLAMSLEERIEIGTPVCAFTLLTASKFAERAARVTVDGDEFWYVNCSVEFVGETADALMAREPKLPVLCWSWGGKKGECYCSVRSAPDGVNVSLIAKKHGGGGHVHASGFRCKVPPHMWDDKPAPVLLPDRAQLSFIHSLAVSGAKGGIISPDFILSPEDREQKHKLVGPLLEGGWITITEDEGPMGEDVVYLTEQTLANAGILHEIVTGEPAPS